MLDKHMDRDGAAIAYSDTGSGPLIGNAHGLFMSRRIEEWLNLVDFSAVRQGHRFLSYDARGHGLSGGRPNAEDYHWPNLSTDLLSLLDKVNEPEPVDFMGLSMGTGTLLWAAISAPQRFRKLVLILPPTAWETRAAQVKEFLDLAELAATEGKAALADQFGGSTPPPILVERFAELADNPATPPADMPDVTEELLPWVIRGAAASDLPSPEQVSTLTHPTLILAADNDPGHPVYTARRLHELMPNSELHLVHTLAEMRAWSELIADFLR